jgi:hypothetical protein
MVIGTFLAPILRNFWKLGKDAVLTLLSRGYGMKTVEFPNVRLENMAKVSEPLRHERPNCLDDGTLAEILEDRILGRYVTSLGYATQEQVQECLRLQGRILESGRQEMRLANLLVARNYLIREQMIRLAREFARLADGWPLEVK